MKKHHIVLSIAGSDSGGGAGIQADIKTISACRCFATTAITAITAQNTQGVRAVQPLSADIVRSQIEAVADDMCLDAIKLGMLPSVEIVEVVASLIEKYNLKNVVLDPVMIATSGDTLVENSVAEAIVTRLFPLISLVTPNIPEAAYISGKKIDGIADFKEVARIFFDKKAPAVLLKTGHLNTNEICDVLYRQGAAKEDLFLHPRIATENTHGTGCTLSSAIASYMARGYDLPEALRRAEIYIYKAIRNGANYQIGQGHGPVHHFYQFWR